MVRVPLSHRFPRLGVDFFYREAKIAIAIGNLF
jgi:hypothetical protein